ncbi:NAD-dependent epimerase/dehydratase family protein [Virgibacillus halodenitrificans]|uniref:NAD-dependent epimerase/dehydratase family protein n=1 Tax=Virgibacillus halodenitrificans TaxID=1482 RepID=UPI0024C0D1F5|nr:NAD-dependent epimerase/dehydratase family protein [Virgibacillus halodenitrificans]WHX26178.1 NAD-dependent epimerase/dehydratase family protein [Virgibacillus halodenitrificans]
MKILITGSSSYVGNAFKEWLTQYPGKYDIDMMSLRNDEWKKISFQQYEVILHTVGIAHVEAKPEMEPLYYKINRDLTIEVAKKAKSDGVKQFIFLSSIIVYGDSSQINQQKVINKETKPNPANFYGDSKLQAEKGILEMKSDSFRVAIIRPPMIYGKCSKGNFPKLVKLSKILPIFPDINNQRSMLFIDNLSEFIRLLINNEEDGIFFPQNEQFINTSHMVELLAKAHGKNILLTKLFNPFIFFAARYFPFINKVFGSLVYDKEMSKYKEEYRIKNLENSLKNIIR